MKRVAWLTDIHLNFLSVAQIRKFIDTIASAGPDAVVISGDIGEADSVVGILRQLEVLARPIYFVLGNHDFYGSSIAEMRTKLSASFTSSRFLHWLSQSGVVRLTQQTALVGCESFADGRYGDYERSNLLLNDYVLIRDFHKLGKKERLVKMHRLGDETAAYARDILPRAFADCSQVILVTHVPPFREASYYEGHIADDEGLPHFTCKALGDALLEVMARHPRQRLLVLCGHTHHCAQAYVRDNLLVLVGPAEYCMPEIVDVLDVE